MNEILSPFANDPFGFIDLAFKNLYPDKSYTCFWTPRAEDLPDCEGGMEGKAYGVTIFDKETGDINVFVLAKGLDVNNAAEVFAHELAHVAVGITAPGEDEHGKAWQTAFDAIWAEYNRIMSGIFGEDAKV